MLNRALDYVIEYALHYLNQPSEASEEVRQLQFAYNLITTTIGNLFTMPETHSNLYFASRELSYPGTMPISPLLAQDPHVMQYSLAYQSIFSHTKSASRLAREIFQDCNQEPASPLANRIVKK